MQTALVSLTDLAGSWDRCLQSISSNDPITDIFLVEIENQHTFTLKKTVERPHFLPLMFQKVFEGDPTSTSFKRQLQKIEQLFHSISDELLSPVQQHSLKDLEKNLNALGSHIFIQRQLSPFSFNRPESFKDFQLHYTTPTALPFPLKIERGLPNSSHTICWLNSAINYLAATKLYEKIICQPVADHESEGLRQRLFFVIEALRNNSHEQIVYSLQNELIEYLKTPKFANLLKGQQDPNDFLLFLRNHFANPLTYNEQIQTVTCYTSPLPTVMKIGIEKPTNARLQISATETPEINIQEELSRQQITESIGSYLINHNGLWQEAEEHDDKLIFQCKEFNVHLPHLLEIWLTRGIAIEGSNQNKTFISQQEIAIEPDGTMMLTEYAPKYALIQDQAILVDATPKALCKYKVIAAIERLGEKTERGHFIAYSRARDNSITKHNDKTLSENMEESVWKKASLLQLELVQKDLLDEP